MCPSQLIQAEDVIIYQSLGLGRNFCQRERREGMRECKSQKKEVPLLSSQSYVRPLRHAKVITLLLFQNIVPFRLFLTLASLWLLE